MKTRLLFTLLFVALCTTSALAAESYQYTGKGTVTFNHKMHGEKMDCSSCHTTQPPQKIAITNKQQGHALCLDCHKSEQKKGNTAAPKSCNQCHKK
ncbi:MAG: cytochrome C [Desulfuromonas sp.]|nr:MAG: cytochrome C [Desulfuromonas sp.]